MKTGGFSIKLEVQSPSLKTLGWCWQICLRARPSVTSSPAASLDLLVEAVLEGITSIGRLLLTKASGVCSKASSCVCSLCLFLAYWSPSLIWIHSIEDCFKYTIFEYTLYQIHKKRKLLTVKEPVFNLILLDSHCSISNWKPVVLSMLYTKLANWFS